MKKPRVIRERKEAAHGFPGDLRGLGTLQDAAPEAYLSIDSAMSPQLEAVIAAFNLIPHATDGKRVVLHVAGEDSYKQKLVTLFIAAVKIAPMCKGSQFLGETIEFRDVLRAPASHAGHTHRMNYPHVKGSEHLLISHVAFAALAQAGLQFQVVSNEHFVGISDASLLQITQAIASISTESRIQPPISARRVKNA